MVSIGSSDPLKSILWLQWIAGMGAMLILFDLGLMIGWTSPYLAMLTAKNSPIPITTDEASWVGSLLNFGRFCGAIVGGISVRCFDSKRTLVIIGFPLILSWICMIMADSVVWLYVSRFAAGLSLGMSFCSFPIFLGEVSSPKIRGALVSFAITGLTLGMMVGNVMGPYVSMMVFSYVSLVPNVTFILLFLWIPQSPHYFVRIEKMEDAQKSIARYDPNVNSEIEVESLKKFIAVSESMTVQERLREFNIPRNRKAGLITIVLFFFMQCSGLNSVNYYQELIFIAAEVTVIPPATLVMITGGFGVISAFVSVYIADKFERKVLLIFSSAGVGVSMSALAIHFALLENGFNPPELQWLPIIFAPFFMFSVSSGVATVPNMILSEFFAPSIKNLAACFASIAIGLFAFGATKSYQPLVDVFGESYFFWAHVVLMVICMIFSAVFLPNTRGKSLQEIQDALMRK